MNIPYAFDQKLAQSPASRAIVDSAVSELTPWLGMSTLPFFREYTNHGVRHIEDVLETAETLVSPSSWEQISPEDIAVFTVATLLHDLALHITEDGFLRLIDPDNPWPCIRDLDDVPWPLLWEKFVQEAVRFDGARLVRLFGDSEPVHRPSDNTAQWTTRDYRLIGEFIRRHHPRLAHEMALFGVPGPSNMPLRITGLGQDLLDLAGLVARSHGLPIRTSIENLRKYDVREYRGVHGVYLFALLRIADYLQIHPERAPRQMMKVYRIRSAVSRREWDNHHAVVELRRTHEDPESIYVDARPRDVSEFVRIRAIIEDIQREVDASWATLGEVYGRYDGLRDLGLTLRRIRSNLDNVDAFSKTTDFLPVPGSFQAENADLLKLLVGPLYGHRPEIALRELIQNAVDATLERSHFEGKNFGRVEIGDKFGPVRASLNHLPDGTWEVTVVDSGIGMTVDIIRDYFLRAGASYRRSDAWRVRFTNEEGKTTVLRSGRFGIGIFATFLLGDEISVTTRHVTAGPDEAITFQASLDSPIIEFRHPKSGMYPNVGTMIKIRVSNDIGTQLSSGSSWDWYCLDDNLVERFVNKEKQEQRHHLPLQLADLSSEWTRVSHPDYSDIQWTYSAAPALTCNGVLISVSSRIPLAGESAVVDLRTPNLSVFDPDGKLPLLLQRTGLASNTLPFSSELFESIIRDLAVFALHHAPHRPLLDIASLEAYGVAYPGLTIDEQRSFTWLPWFCTGIGVGPTDPGCIATCRPKRIIAFPAFRTSAAPPLVTMDSEDLMVCLKTKNRHGSLESILAEFQDSFSRGIFRYLTLLGWELIVPQETLKATRSALPRTWRKHAYYSMGEMAVLFGGEIPHPSKPLPTVERSHGMTCVFHVASERPTMNNQFTSVWNSIFNQSIIPFTPTERGLLLRSLNQNQEFSQSIPRYSGSISVRNYLHRWGEEQTITSRI